MLDFDLIKNVLIVGMAAGIITTSLVQKFKWLMPSSGYIPFLSFVISMVVGTLFALTFSNIGIIDALWVGLFAFIGADMLYQAFKDKIFTPFGDGKDNPILIERDDLDEL